MGFGAAYYISKYESDLKTGEKRLTSDYKKYQEAKFAMTLGFLAQKDGETIMFSNGQAAIFVGERPVSDAEFLINTKLLRDEYNKLRLAVLEKDINARDLSSRAYQPLNTSFPAKHNSDDFAYPDAFDPVVYMSNLLQDLKDRGKTEQYRALRQCIQEQCVATIKKVRETEWGSRPISPVSNNSFADSLQKFAENNIYLIDKQDQMGE